MDTTALSLCMDNNLPIYVFALARRATSARVLAGRAHRHDHLDAERRRSADGDGRRADPGRARSGWSERRAHAHRVQHRPHRPRVRRAARPRPDRLLRQPTPLKQLATINVPEPRMLTIQPFDPTSIKAIEKAIQESDLGLTPSNDGKIIRLPMPAADRGAPQGAREGRPQDRGGGQGRGAKRPPRRRAPPQGPGEEARSARTTSTAQRSASRS